MIHINQKNCRFRQEDLVTGIPALGNVSSGLCETEVKFYQGQNPKKPRSRSTADRDYVYARKRYKKGDFQNIDLKGYFLKIWTLYVRSPDILKPRFKNNDLRCLSGRSVSEIRTKISIKVEK